MTDQIITQNDIEIQERLERYHQVVDVEGKEPKKTEVTIDDLTERLNKHDEIVKREGVEPEYINKIDQYSSVDDIFMDRLKRHDQTEQEEGSLVTSDDIQERITHAEL